MELALSGQCPIFEAHNAIHLHALLRTVVAGWHGLVSPSMDELEVLLGSTWTMYEELLSKGDKSASYAPRYLRPDACETCDPASLANLLSSPVVLLVENATTDGRFVEAVSSRLRPRVYRQFSGARPSVVIAQGGGIGELPKEIRRHVKMRANATVPGLPRRMVVVADSDARFPGELSAQASQVRSTAIATGVDHWILTMRSIENYIPDPALHEYAVKRTHADSVVRVLETLSVPARDHYPMKRGLPVEDDRHPNETAIYGTGIPADMGMGDFIEDFLENFPWHLKRQDIEARDHSGELNQLLDTIEGNL